MKLIKQKINEKNLPPNPDIIKLIFAKTEVQDYENLSDEELLKEREKLLKILQEEEDDSGKNKAQN